MHIISIYWYFYTIIYVNTFKYLCVCIYVSWKFPKTPSIPMYLVIKDSINNLIRLHIVIKDILRWWIFYCQKRLLAYYSKLNLDIWVAFHQHDGKYSIFASNFNVWNLERFTSIAQHFCGPRQVGIADRGSRFLATISEYHLLIVLSLLERGYSTP